VNSLDIICGRIQFIVLYALKINMLYFFSCSSRIFIIITLMEENSHGCTIYVKV
jgi:hypothetical protein